jgi:pre-rRNA-processing protein TSR3
MKIKVVMLKQDDPKKCSAQKLVKFGLAKNVRKISNNTLVLNPFAKKTLLPRDKSLVNSITAIDCSWSLAEQTFAKKLSGIHRKLPPFFAGNPVNYSKIGKLTTVEAISAALFILGNHEIGNLLLDKFKWGHTFYELNQNLINDYLNLISEGEIAQILKEYQITQ